MADTNRILAGSVLESIRATTPGHATPRRYDARPLIAGIGAWFLACLFILAACAARGA